MPLDTIPLPFGLRDVKVAPLEADGTPGTKVDLPNSQTLSFTESEDFTTLRGDDKNVASHGGGPGLEWELEAGGISFEALVVMAGGSIASSGTTPAQVKTYTRKVTDVRPYFYIEGQSISDSGGDFHGIIYRAKTTGDIEGTMEDGEFWTTGLSGEGFGSLNTTNLDKLYDFVQNETATAIT